MVRILFETSVPASTLKGLTEALGAAAARGGLAARVETVARGACAGPATGGDADWTPCWVSLEAESPDPARVAAALRDVKALVAAACRSGGLEVFAVPSNAQVGDEFRRFKDLLDVVECLK